METQREASRTAQDSVFALPSQSGLLFVLIVLAIVAATIVDPLGPTMERFATLLVSESVDASPLSGVALRTMEPQTAIHMVVVALILAFRLLLCPLVVALAAVLLWLKPRSLSRRHALTDLSIAYPHLAARYTSLASEMGVSQAPRLWLSPSPAAGAFVFGTFGTPNVCVTAGMIDRLHGRPEVLDTVIAHEMGHVANGDVTRTELAEGLVKAYFWMWIILCAVQASGFFLVAVVVGRTDVAWDYSFLISLLFVAVTYACMNALSRVRQSFADARVVELGHGSALAEAIVSVSTLLSLRRGGRPMAVRSLAFSSAEVARAGRAVLSRSLRLIGPEPDFWARRAAIADPSELLRPRVAVSFAAGFITYRLSLALPIDWYLQLAWACAATLAMAAPSIIPFSSHDTHGSHLFHTAKVWVPQAIATALGVFAAGTTVQFSQRLAYSVAIMPVEYVSMWAQTSGAEPLSYAGLAADTLQQLALAGWSLLTLVIFILPSVFVMRYVLKRFGPRSPWNLPRDRAPGRIWVIALGAAALAVYVLQAASAIGSAWHVGIATAYGGQGDLEEQMRHSLLATEVRPWSFLAWNALASAQGTAGDFRAAVGSSSVAIALNSRQAVSYALRGTAYTYLGEDGKAMVDFDTAVSLGPRYSHAYRDRAKAYSEAGEYEKALADFGTAISLGPWDASAYVDRATTYASLGELGKAIDDYDTAIRLDPLNAAAHNGRGAAYARRGEGQKAKTDFVATVSLSPSIPFIRYDRGIAFSYLGEYDEAVAEFDAELAAHPRYARGYMARGHAYVRLAEYEKAINDFDAAIALEPMDANAYIIRGDAYYTMGELQKAVADFDTAISQSPKNVAAYTGRANVFNQLVEQRKAIADYDVAISLNQREATTFTLRGNAYSALGEHQKAVADYDAAIAIEPRNAFAYTFRGSSYSMLGEYQRAIADYDIAISLSPTYAFAYTGRGNAHSRLGEHKEAIADYASAIYLNPADTSNYISRGNGYSRMGNYQRAIIDYDAYLALDPKNTMAYLFRGNAYSALGEHQKAVADYDAATAIEPGNALAYTFRGSSYSVLGEYQRAIADYDIAISLSPTYAFAYTGRGNAYLRLGENAKAMSDLQRAGELEPRSTGAH